MLENDPRRRLKVGLFAAGLLALLAASILVIGSKQGVFVRHVRYHCRFAYVCGLGAGAPVHLNGVAVGDVVRVDLPADPAHLETEVTFRVDARVEPRIRSDSQVRIRSLGLLGDRYLEVSGGRHHACSRNGPCCRKRLRARKLSSTTPQRPLSEARNFSRTD